MRLHRLYLLPFAIILIGGVVRAQDTSQRAALREMSGVSVQVAPLNSGARDLGLDQRQLQIDIELRLRRARVPVFETSKRPPILFIQVNGAEATQGLYAYNITVDVVEEVEVQRKTRHFIMATIWSDSVGGTVGVRAGGSVRERLGELVDGFINDYLAANP